MLKYKRVRRCLEKNPEILFIQCACNLKVLQKTGFHMAVTAGVLQNPTVLGRPGQQHIKARSSRRKGSPISIFVEEAQGSLAASSAVK